MTSLNSKLQLAVLNRKKGRNLLEKGFTLVELMIVIVIVGILSAVALPNFLNQTEKARAAEARSLGKTYLTNHYIAALEGGTALTAISNRVDDSTTPGACPLNTNNWLFTCGAYTITANPNVNSGGSGLQILGSVNSSTGAISGL